MKINGKKIEGVNIKSVWIERGDDLMEIKCQTVSNFKEFDALVSAPTPPTIVRPGGAESKDVDSPKFKDELNHYANLKAAWFSLKSLSATEGLEWDTVDFEDPNTWVGWSDELEKSGMSHMELNRIVEGISQANGVDDSHIKAARKSFLPQRPPQ